MDTKLCFSLEPNTYQNFYEILLRVLLSPQLHPLLNNVNTLKRYSYFITEEEKKNLGPIQVWVLPGRDGGRSQHIKQPGIVGREAGQEQESQQEWEKTGKYSEQR